MFKVKLLSISIACSLLLTVNVQASQFGKNITVEEKRISIADKASAEMASVTKRHDPRVQLFEQQLLKARNYTALTQLILRHANALWKEGVAAYADANDFDDRPLYWARLKMTKALRQAPLFSKLLPMQQEKLLWTFELLSRGQHDVKFDKNADIKILLTGFDPFFLDKNIDQSNPSGVAALAFDNLFLSIEGKSVEIETVILPVRFEDFDRGMVETLLKPFYKKERVDMIFTVSMGRDDFDIERFPGLRRSAAAPDNLNILTGANEKKPLVATLNGKPLSDKEFLEFSLPIKAMQQAKGAFKVNDNHKVTTLNKTFEPESLSELADEVAVSGSGGGYLSNEISYRSLVLREKYYPVMPVGHIHTPRFKGFKPEKTKEIVAQIKAMIAKASATVN